jgi:hypothetical protein
MIYFYVLPFLEILTFFFSCLTRVRHQEIHTFSLENIRKYQKIPKNFRKYLEISGNTCTFEEILENIRKYYEIPGNTRPKT